jgi:hypothetical protein
VVCEESTAALTSCSPVRFSSTVEPLNVVSPAAGSHIVQSPRQTERPRIRRFAEGPKANDVD